MLGGCMRSFWTSWAILSLASGGPLHRYPRESEDYQNDLSVYANYTANEVCFSEGEVFQKGDVMPNPGPCEECRCEPPSIVCNMLKCPVNNNGCRTIQRANHCCPDYNCECDYNGQLYNDGERLELPEEPCQVCYCKGGEVMCNSITCYHRDDCDPIEVAGQCCPKYENCPVRDMGSPSFDDKNVLVRSANKTNHVSPKREMNPWLLTKVPSVSSSSPPKSPQDATTEGGNVIIVSDWLTERRSTTEDATRDESGSTDGPDLLTDSEHLTTAVRPNFSMDGEIAVKNYHTDAPLDEVIFTRIDGQKENQEVTVNGPTPVSTEVIDEKVTTRDLVSGTTPSTKGNTVDVKVTENPFLIHNLNEDFNERNTSLNTPIKQISLEVNAEETAIKDKEHANNFEEVEENEKNIKLFVSTEIYPGINISEERSTNSDFMTSTLNMDSLKKNLEYDVLSNTSSENVTKLDSLSQGKIEQETTVNSITGSYNTEKLETVTEIDEVTNNLFEDQTKEDHMLDKLELDVNRVETTDGPLAISTNSAIGNDVTPIFIEVNLEREKVDDHVPEIPKMKEETYKDSNKSEMVISTPVDQRKDAIIKDQLFFTTTTTTMSSPTTSSETKIKRNNFNSSKHEIGDVASMNINKSAILEATHHTRIISEDNLELQNNTFNQTSNSSVSETLIIGADKTIPTTPVTLDEVSDDSKELISDAPPVLELNSHVPFLQLGGHGNVDPVLNAFEGTHQPSTYTAGSGVEEEYFTSLTSKIPEDSLPVKQAILADNKTELDENVHASVQESKENIDERELDDTETTTDITSTTSHIPLTPGDLKALAEYLINDTIKTVEVKNSSDYTPNQWLKGNLTSEENMSSILSAANISINIMSKEDNKVRKYMPETVTKISEATRLDKYEQEKHSSGNSLMNNLKLVNKTGFIQGKNHGYLDSPKINSEPETPLNDEAKEDVTTIRTNSESLNNIKDSPPKTTITSLNKPVIQQNNLDKNNAQHLNPAPQSVHKLNDADITTENNHRFDNVNPIDKAEIDKSTQNKITRSDKLLEAKATSFLSLDLTTTSSPVKQATR